MIKFTKSNNGQIEGTDSGLLPYLTLIRNPEDLKNFCNWRHYYISEENVTYPCWGMEVEYRCDSTYYFFTIEELEELLNTLKGVKNA